LEKYFLAFTVKHKLTMKNQTNRVGKRTWIFREMIIIF